ncbi:MAG: hypothetical protein Q8K89_13445, partial [Actinomycetota bacterium]|nr:hypothetical protein [Actinomycetota bacterium]
RRFRTEHVGVGYVGALEYHPPDAKLEALTDAVRFGLLKDSPRRSRILGLVFKRSWMSPMSLALLGLLNENGDPVRLQLSMAVNANHEAAVECILKSF